MNIELEVTKKEKVDIKYICANVGPRYWEDGDVNGEQDIEFEEQKNGAAPRMPLAVEIPNPRYNDEKYRWEIKIDIETGDVVGWPSGVKGDIHYKVCDDGTYWLEDSEGNKIHEIDDYVPDLFDFCDDSYGDYIIMTINENGHVEEWYNKKELQHRIQEFLKREGF